MTARPPLNAAKEEMMAKTTREILQAFTDDGALKAVRYRSLVRTPADQWSKRSQRAFARVAAEYYRHCDRRLPEDRAWLAGWHSVHDMIMATVRV
jgi:hypothetical protein